MTGRIPAEVFPPGEILRDELEARGWTQNDLAVILGRPFRLVNEVISGKRAISPETARGLGEALDTDPQFWMNLETAYRLSLVSGKEGEVAKRAKLYARAPIKDMIRRHWIESSDRVEEIERQVLRFFEIPSLDTTPSLAAAARKSGSYSETTSAQLAWIYRVKGLASTIPAPPYNEGNLDRLLANLGSLTSSEQEARRVPRLLTECGIRFLVVEHLPKTKIDGVALWLDAQSPVIALSIRFDRIDSFWFTLAHELAHIKYRHVSGVDIDIVGEAPPDLSDESEHEVLANEFASSFLVPPKEMDSFIARIRPLYSRTRINQFANRIRVHPGVIIGQLQRREEIKYSQGREMLVKVRDIVTETSVTDGWGHFPHIAEHTPSF
jgi:HTH-type transcriptional regulator / antitoxin HigA